MSTFETEQKAEQVILVGIDDGSDKTDTKTNLDELAQLVKTSGGEVAGRLIQKREKMHPTFYLGKGKLDELKDLISLTNATGIVCDDELSGAQMKNMEQAL